ncbi:MAG: protein-disulfide reductase DsbD domain-containing protein [Acidobacteriaceae bacterium]
MRARSLALAVGLMVSVAAAVGLETGLAAQKFPWQTEQGGAQGKTPPAVTFVGPEQIEVAARQPQEVELHFRVAQGLHINSHAPHSKNLIPTQLMVADEGGLNTTAVDFPPGTDTSFSFAPTEKLSVYTGDVVLRAHLTATRGDHLLQGALRYQACDANACMPPRKIPVAVSVLAK